MHPACRLAADAAAAAPKELTQEIVRLKGGAAAQKEATLLALCRWAPLWAWRCSCSGCNSPLHAAMLQFQCCALVTLACFCAADVHNRPSARKLV